MADGLTNQIATKIADWASGLTGGTASVATMRGLSSTPVDALKPDAPYTVVGPPKGSRIPGSWDRLFYTFPLRCYIGRFRSTEQSQHDANEWLDAFITATQTGIQLGGLVIEAYISAWDTDKWAQNQAGEDFQVVEMTMTVEVARGETFTA